MTTQPTIPQTILFTSVLEKKPVIDYTAALRQYRQYGRGRSMRRFCSDEGYDYRRSRYCSQRGIKETSIQSTALMQTSDKVTGFIALMPEKELDIKQAIIRICKLNRMPLSKYIAHILESLSATKGEKDLESLLPYNYALSLQN